ncbi:hypothetical protein BJV74DRAFT_890112 [Russula compacta]|nr:hypothetical protein BJV74DRAFT_890112 [Russula compacta]
MNNKWSAKNHPAATGTWKSKRITENTNPANSDSDSTQAAPAQLRPKPRPAYGKDVTKAAEALISMQNALKGLASTPPKHNELGYGDILGLIDKQKDKPEKEEDADSISSDEPEELSSDDCNSRIGSVPVESPKKRLDKFDILFEVPFKNATRDMEGITSHTTFGAFLESLAEKMETRISLLSSIAYIPSYKPKIPKPVPKLLEDEAKNKGKGLVKAFSILIINTSGVASKDAGSAKSRKQASVDPQPALPYTSDQLKEQELLKRLEKHHFCQEHKKPCLVEADGHYYHYTTGDLMMWVMLLGKQKATIDDPPEALKLTNKAPCQHAIKTSTAAAQPADPNAPPAWLPSMMAGILGPFAMMQAGGVFGSHQLNVLQAPAPTPLINTNQAEQVVMPSKCQVSVDYPDIIPLLTSLDGDYFQGKKNLHFAQYGAALLENGILDLSDIVSLTPEKLQDLGEMNFGIANCLIGYAREDDEELQGDVK